MSQVPPGLNIVKVFVLRHGYKSCRDGAGGKWPLRADSALPLSRSWAAAPGLGRARGSPAGLQRCRQEECRNEEANEHQRGRIYNFQMAKSL